MSMTFKTSIPGDKIEYWFSAKPFQWSRVELSDRLDDKEDWSNKEIDNFEAFEKDFAVEISLS